MSRFDGAAISLFCEDARAEKSEQVTLVGIFNDNIVLPDYPAVLPKFCIFTRIIVPTTFPAADFDFYLEFANGTEILVGNISKNFLHSTLKDAVAAGKATAGINLQSLATPFAVEIEGTITAKLKVNAQVIETGSITFTKPA